MVGGKKGRGEAFGYVYMGGSGVLRGEVLEDEVRLCWGRGGGRDGECLGTCVRVKEEGEI